MKNLNKVFLSLLVLGFSPVSNSSANTSPLCPNESGFFYTNYRVRNPTQGGFVSDQAFVQDSDNVFISPTAAVCGASSVTGSVKIFGNAVIKSAILSGNVVIRDNAKVTRARLRGEVEVSENAIIDGVGVLIQGSAMISGHAHISGDAKIGGTAEISGYARINTGTYLSEKIAPVSAPVEVDADSAEKLERKKYMDSILNEQISIAKGFNRENEVEAKKNAQKIYNLWQEYFIKIVSPNIESIKKLMEQRRTADFSELNTIDEKIKKLNIENALLISKNDNYYQSIFMSDLYLTFENYQLRELAMKTEKLRLQFFAYSQTYGGTFDATLGSKQFVTVDEAEQCIARGESNYRTLTNRW